MSGTYNIDTYLCLSLVCNVSSRPMGAYDVTAVTAQGRRRASKTVERPRRWQTMSKGPRWRSPRSSLAKDPPTVLCQLQERGRNHLREMQRRGLETRGSRRRRRRETRGWSTVTEYVKGERVDRQLYNCEKKESREL